MTNTNLFDTIIINHSIKHQFYYFIFHRSNAIRFVIINTRVFWRSKKKGRLQYIDTFSVSGLKQTYSTSLHSFVSSSAVCWGVWSTQQWHPEEDPERFEISPFFNLHCAILFSSTVDWFYSQRLSRMDAATDAMTAFGFDERLVQKTVKQLLKVSVKNLVGFSCFGCLRDFRTMELVNPAIFWIMRFFWVTPNFA